MTDAIASLAETLRKRRAGSTSPFARLHAAAGVPSGTPEPAKAKPAKRRKPPNFISMVKRAQKAGLEVTGVTMTADGVSLKLGKRPAADLDGEHIETPDELRALI